MHARPTVLAPRRVLSTVRRRLFVALAATCLAVSLSTGVATAHIVNIVSGVHCTASAWHWEGTEGGVSHARATLAFTGEYGVGCEEMKIEMQYYYTCGLAACIGTVTNRAILEGDTLAEINKFPASCYRVKFWIKRGLWNDAQWHSC